MKELRLQALVEALKAELRKTTDSDPMFQVSSASITTKVVAREAITGTTAVEFFVFSAGIDATTDSEQAHEITVELRPLEDLQLGAHNE